MADLSKPRVDSAGFYEHAGLGVFVDKELKFYLPQRSVSDGGVYINDAGQVYYFRCYNEYDGVPGKRKGVVTTDGIHWHDEDFIPPGITMTVSQRNSAYLPQTSRVKCLNEPQLIQKGRFYNFADFYGPAGLILRNLSTWDKAAIVNDKGAMCIPSDLVSANMRGQFCFPQSYHYVEGRIKPGGSPAVICYIATPNNAAPVVAKSEPPSLLALANLCNEVYSGDNGYGTYKIIENNSTLVPATSGHADFAAKAYATSDSSQVVVAIRGTVPGYWLNDIADTSFSGSVPTVAFGREVSDASKFLKKIEQKYPDANITITGHSLGGSIAQVLGEASGLSTYAFNAPGARSLYSHLTSVLGDFVPNAHSDLVPVNVNYRIYGDQLSLFGQPMGRVVILAAPTADLQAIKKSVGNVNVEVAGAAARAFAHVHFITTMITQIANHAPEVSNDGEPNNTGLFKTN